MRQRPPVLQTTASHVVVLFALMLGAVAGATSSAAAQTAPPADGAPLDEQVLAPPTVGFFNWNRVPAFFLHERVAPVLWPDGTIRGFFNVDNASLGAGPGAVMGIDPLGGLPRTPESDDAVPPGSLHGRTVRLDRDALWQDQLVAYRGRNWTLEVGRRLRLVERDEAFGVLRTRTTRRSVVEGSRLLLTRDGPRVVTEDLDGVLYPKPRVDVRDERLRVIASLKLFELLSASVTARGRLVLIGTEQIVTVGPRGRITRVPTGSGPRQPRPARWWTASTTPAARGTVVAFGRGKALRRAPLHLGRIDAAGAVRGAKSFDRLGVPWPGECGGRRPIRELRGLRTGPASTPIVIMNCGGYYGPNTSVAFELDAGLRFRRFLYVGVEGRLLLGPLADGRTGVITLPVGGTTDAVGARLGAIALPSAIAPTLGAAPRILPGRKAGEVLVRLRCRRPVGTICSGIVTIRSASGATLGWAPYALPGRPTWAPAVFDRRVELRAGAGAGALREGATLPAGATAQLSPLPASIDRSAVEPPTGSPPAGT